MKEHIMVKCLIVLGGILFTCCRSSSVPIHERAPSLVAILATPERFHGKDVLLVGYLDTDSDRQYWGLYLNKEAAKVCLRNGVRILLSDEEMKLYSDFVGKYCYVDGKYDMHGGGYLWSGSLKQIRHIEPVGETTRINLTIGEVYKTKPPSLD